MRIARLIALVLYAVAPVLAHAEGGDWKPFQGRYLTHSKTASYPEAPTKADRIVTVMFDGSPAKELFDLIGPDLPATCSGEKGDRLRDKKGVRCSYTEQDAGSKAGPYRCWIGIDLKTGNGDVRVSC